MTRNQYAIIEMLEGAQTDMDAFRTETCEKFDEIDQRLRAIERGIGGVQRAISELNDERVQLRASVDRLAERVDRIERHLDLDA